MINPDREEIFNVLEDAVSAQNVGAEDVADSLVRQAIAAFGDAGLEDLLGDQVEEVLTPDTEEAARTNGVNITDVIQSIGGGSKNIIGDIIDMSNMDKSFRNKISDLYRKRRLVGIVYDNESRDRMVEAGEIPAYYSKSNIIKLISEGKIPYGWSLQVLANQGFGEYVSLEKLKKQKIKQLEYYNRDRAVVDSMKKIENSLKVKEINNYYDSLSKTLKNSFNF